MKTAITVGNNVFCDNREQPGLGGTWWDGTVARQENVKGNDGLSIESIETHRNNRVLVLNFVAEYVF